MIQRPQLTAEDVRRIGDAALAAAAARKLAVTVAVCDDGGHLLWLQRMDGCAPVAAHIAPSKARTAAMGRRPSADYEKMINDGRTAFVSAPAIDGLLEGGVPIVVDGHHCGAVGVSGAKPADDVAVAEAGVAALRG